MLISAAKDEKTIQSFLKKFPFFLFTKSSYLKRIRLIVKTGRPIN